jgi:ABC-2 type transport system ATP-binding protein
MAPAFDLNDGFCYIARFPVAGEARLGLGVCSQPKSLMPLIEAQNLVKRFHVAQRKPGVVGAFTGLFKREYKTVNALEGVSFSIEPGELVAYIGPNGAGKSTTVKILSGILVPDSGECRVLGRVPWKERVEHVRRIGVVFGQRTQLWWDLPVIESFEMIRDIYGVKAGDYAKRSEELIGLLDLGPILNTPARQLSLGQRMRCDLAASLFHAPELLFLDEPTIGLDAVSKLAVRGFIKKLNKERGVTVILTTHDMDDIEALCRRVIVIANGRILSDGTLEALRAKVSRERRLMIDVEEAFEGEVADEEAVVVKREGRRFELAFDPQQTSAAALIGRLAARYPVKDLFVEDPAIEEIIARLYGEVKP